MQLLWEGLPEPQCSRRLSLSCGNVHCTSKGRCRTSIQENCPCYLTGLGTCAPCSGKNPTVCYMLSWIGGPCISWLSISLHSAVHEALLPGNSHNKFKLAERGKRAETCTKRIEYSLSPFSTLLISMTRRWIPATMPSCVPS